MMVPRAYTYAAPKATAAVSFNEKDSTSHMTQKGTQKSPQKKREAPKTSRTYTGISPSPSTPSKPVVIPTRTKQDGRRKSRGQEFDTREPKRSLPADHDRSRLSPSASALLAMTTIPAPKRNLDPNRRRTSAQGRHRDFLRNVDSENSGQTLSSSSPRTWKSLMSPPEEDEVDSESIQSDTTVGRLSSARSISTESTPSLEADNDSLYSSSNPGTPGLNGSSRSGRKSLSTSKGEECALNHPLLPSLMQTINPIPENAEIEIETPEVRASPSPIQRNSTFKSNLTASFRAVRSAARSFSNFTSPPSNIHREDLLSESLLSLTLPYAVERRPPPSSEPPDPALRRYLNPITLSPSELHFHREPTHTKESSSFQIKASIQLQPCQRGPRLSEHASAPPIFLPQSTKAPQNHQGKQQQHQQHVLGKNALDTEDTFTTSPLLPRQREPRENSDFLRMIVLEMNMRKCGKLSNSDPGRARLWLPARQIGKVSTLYSSSSSMSLSSDDAVREETEKDDGDRTPESEEPETTSLETDSAMHTIQNKTTRTRPVPRRWTSTLA